MMLVGLLIILLIVSGTTNALSLPDQLNRLGNVMRPQIRNLAAQHLPKTYGNCKERNPPAKCEEGGNLYVKRQRLYKVKARWISGINDLNLDSFAVAPMDDGRLNISLVIRTTDLPMSLRLETCTRLTGCVKLWDNTSACCGKNKRLWATIIASCNTQSPYLRNPILSFLHMDQIKVYNKIFGKYKVKLADVTKAAENGVKQAVRGFLTSNLIDDANGLLKSLYGRFDLNCLS